MKSSKKLTEWAPRYETGIEEIDQQHKKLIETINELYDGLNDRVANRQDVFRKGAHDSLQYVREHFTFEEKWMEEQGYPELRHQQSEHAKFIRQLVEDAQSFSDSNPQSAFRFVRFLNDWLLSHIAIEDRQFREFRNKRDASSRNPPTETST